MDTECIFCRIVSGDAESWKVLETKTAYAFLDINPVATYHTLVVPKVHCMNVFDASQEVLSETMQAVKDVVTLFNEKLGIEDVQIINSSGSLAQQDVFHLHFHVIPRAENDGQDITPTYRPELRDQFDDMIAKLL